MSALSCCKKWSVLILAVVCTVLIIYYSTDLYGLVVFNEDTEFEDVSHLKKNVDTDHTVSFSATQKPSLSQDVIDRVEKFVFFIGYPRSGHSIIGSFLDAHPHTIIAQEFKLFGNWRELFIVKQKTRKTVFQDKAYLFNALYRSSVRASDAGWRSQNKDSKNYTINVDSPWLGKYDRYISVIGDKSGGMTSIAYKQSPENFTANYKQLQKTVGIPIKVLHCVRNPYDLVSTSALYAAGRNPHHNTTKAMFVSSFRTDMSKLWGTSEFMKARFDRESLLEKNIHQVENKASAVMKITDLVGASNVLELHNSDLVRDPNSTITKICTFLEIDCSPDYLQACSRKVFKSVSKSRELVVWPQRLQNMMKDLIENYPFFHGYSFTSE